MCVCAGVRGGVLQIPRFCDCVTEILTLVTLTSNEKNYGSELGLNAITDSDKMYRCFNQCFAHWTTE